jgi:protein AIR1/2
VKPAGLRLSFGSKVARTIEKNVVVPTSQEAEPAADEDVVQEPAAETSAEETNVVADEPVADEPASEGPPASRGEARRRRRQEKKAAKSAAEAPTTSVEQQSSTVEKGQPQKSERKTRAQALKAAEAAAAAAAAATAGPKEPQTTVAKERIRRYKFAGQTWKLPPPPGPEWGLDESSTWQFKFEQWAQDYVALNNTDKKVEILRDPKRVCSVLPDAYGRLQATRDLKRKAVAPVVQYKKQDRLPRLIAVIMDNLAQGKSISPQPLLLETGAGDPTDASAKPDAPVIEQDTKSAAEEPVQVRSSASRSPGEIPEDTDDVDGDMDMDEVEDEAYRQRYYPGIPNDQVFCTSCASCGHRATSCPEGKCPFCRKSTHMAPGCPTRQRCFKCKQLGHVKDDCPEKLALAPGEGMECAFCASKDHTESDCAEFFRAFRPSVGNMRKVKHIPIFCYCCGNEGHYGTECGLNPAPIKTARVETWSKENWQQFVDPDSVEDATAWASAAGGSAYAHDANGRPDFGKSIVPRTHIIFEDEDDEEEAFIRPPVQRQPHQQQHQNPQINVSRPSRGGFSSLAQQAYSQNPPLPPGPPPGLPARPPQSNENGKQQRRQPRKPNQSRANGHSNGHGRGNGQQNARGGGGGGGGFRVRGGANRGGGRGGRR